MDLSPYLDTLRRELIASAAPGGTDVRHAAELLTGSLDAAARLTLLELLSDAAAEITTRLQDASVEVRLRGRDADLVVSHTATEPPVAQPAPPAADAGDLTRLTLRMPESLKTHIEQTAASEGISVNAWLVRAVTAAVHQPAGRPPAPGRAGKRVTGFYQA